MEELIKKLKESCEQLQLISELTEKYKKTDIVCEKLLHKKIEDGILSNLGNANIYQLKMLKSSYRFKYYGNEITDKLIDIQIKKTTRKDKLKTITEKASL